MALTPICYIAGIVQRQNGQQQFSRCLFATDENLTQNSPLTTSSMSCNSLHYGYDAVLIDAKVSRSLLRPTTMKILTNEQRSVLVKFRWA